MIRTLPKNEHANFPFAANRAPPNLAAVSAATEPTPMRARGAATPENVAAAQLVKSHLLGVRSGDLPVPGGHRVGIPLTVNGVTKQLIVLDSVSTMAGVTFYHLTDEARATLRDGLALPWGG